jgi:PAS domain S-box-containing protein
MPDTIAPGDAVFARPLDERISPRSLSPRPVVEAVCVAGAYYAGTKLGLLLTPVGQPISTLWPPNAILFAALLLAPPRRWLLLVAAVLPVHLIVQLSSGIPLTTSLGWYCSNISEALLGAGCLHLFGWTGSQRLFETFRGIIAFIVFGVVLAPFITSFVDVGVVVTTAWGSDYWALWRDRFFSNMLSNLTLVPPIVVIGSKWRFDRKARRQYAEALVLGLGILLVVIYVLGINVSTESEPALLYLLLPFLLWAAVRFGSAGASASLLLVALLTIWNATHGRGPFANEVRSLQIFLAAINIPLLCLGAVLEERRKVENELRSNHDLLNLISGIAETFVNLSWERIDGEIERSLERVRDFLGVDRVSLFEFKSDETFLLHYSAWSHRMPCNIWHSSQIDWSMRHLRHGKVALISELNELPEEAPDGDFLRDLGIRSVALVPLSSDESLRGLLTVVSLTSRRTWSEDLIATLRVLGEILFDSMQRKNAMQALSESEERFRRIADQSPMLVWVSGVEGKYNYVNSSWLRFTGRALEEEVGDGWLHSVHPEDVEECRSVVQAALSSHRQFHLEYRVRRHDGQYRWILDTGVPRFDIAGAFLGFVGSALDITDRKRAEEVMATFSGRLIKAQEAERQRIARELHDDVGQRLALLAIELDELREHLDPSLQRTVVALLQAAKDTSESVREISHNLHSAGLDLLPLGTGLKALCRDFNHQDSLDICFSEHDVPATLPQDVKLCFYRIAQEALQNIAKHSRARTAIMNLTTVENKLVLTVIDDGIGFSHQPYFTGLGLTSMRERLRLLGGGLKVVAGPGEGTKIEASIELPLAYPFCA